MLRLCSLQLPIIILNFLLMVTLNHSWFQNYYCKCLSGNFIIERWVPQRRMDLRRQDMQKIISWLVILHHDQFFHPNLRRCLQGTKSCVVASAAYLQKLFIHHYYNDVIVIWVSSMIAAKMRKTEDPLKSIIAYLIHIKTLWWHMGVIYTKQQLIWPWLQCVHIQHRNMHCHTENVCFVVGSS